MVRIEAGSNGFVKREGSEGLRMDARDRIILTALSELPFVATDQVELAESAVQKKRHDMVIPIHSNNPDMPQTVRVHSRNGHKDMKVLKKALKRTLGIEEGDTLKTWLLESGIIVLDANHDPKDIRRHFCNDIESIKVLRSFYSSE